MNDGKILILPAIILCAVMLIGGVVGVFLIMKNQKEEKSYFDYARNDVFSGDGCRLSEDGLYHAEPVTEFLREGEIVIDAEKESVKSVRFISTLWTADQSADDVEKNCNLFLQNVTERIGFSQFGEPQKIQYCDNETYKHCPEDPKDALLEGYVLFEYSFRDADSVLWIVHLYSPAEDILNGMVLKLIDESDYEGYQAQMEWEVNK